MVAASPANPTTPARARSDPHRKAGGTELAANRPLNRQEERFCQLVAQGWPLGRCYLEATGSKASKSNAERQAWRWRLRPVVVAEIQRQRAQLSDATVATRTEKRNILSDLMRNEKTPAAVRVSAIQVENAMSGDNEPVRVSVSGKVVFVCDPIGDGTRGQRTVTELPPEALPAAPDLAEPPQLPP